MHKSETMSDLTERLLAVAASWRACPVGHPMYETGQLEAMLLERAAAALAEPVRVPDGWIVIHPNLHREVMFNSITANEYAARGCRVRPFVFADGAAPAAPAVPTPDDTRVFCDVGINIEGKPWCWTHRRYARVTDCADAGKQAAPAVPREGDRVRARHLRTLYFADDEADHE